MVLSSIPLLATTFQLRQKMEVATEISVSPWSQEEDTEKSISFFSLYGLSSTFSF